MKAILEFNFPEEEELFNSALKANDYKSVLFEIYNQLRTLIKYNDSISEENMLFAANMQKKFFEILEEHDVEIFG